MHIFNRILKLVVLVSTAITLGLLFNVRLSYSSPYSQNISINRIIKQTVGSPYDYSINYEIIDPNILGVKGTVGSSRNPSGQPLPAIQDYIPPNDPRFLDYVDKGYFFLRKKQKSSELPYRLIQNGAEQVGIPARATTSNVVILITDEIFVRFGSDIPTSDIEDIIEKEGFFVESSPFPDGRKNYIIRSKDFDPQTSILKVNKFKQYSEVEFAYLNVEEESSQRSENFEKEDFSSIDPYLESQWHLNLVSGTDHTIQDVWNITEGFPSVSVAIIEEQGIELNHPDIITNIFVNLNETFNGSDSDGNGLIDDVNGFNFPDQTYVIPPHEHGTAVASLALAARDNSEGGSGVAPKANFLPIVSGTNQGDKVRALEYAKSMGVKVINCSWGLPRGIITSPALYDAISDASQNSVVIFSMTNRNVDNFNPTIGGEVMDISSHPDVVAVGRSTDNNKWGESGFGDGMKLIAPANAARATPISECSPTELIGEKDIVSADRTGRKGYNKLNNNSCSCNRSVTEGRYIDNNLNYTNCFGGTSASAPIVSGVAALVYSINPSLSPQEVKEILYDSVNQIEKGRANYQNDITGRPYSITHGYGRVNAYSAVILARSTLNRR